MNGRRIAATVALSGALMLASAPLAGAAVAPELEYPSAEGTLACSATTVAPGAAFTCDVTAPSGAVVTLSATFPTADVTIAGTKSLTKTVAAGETTVRYNLTAPMALGKIAISAAAPGVTFGNSSTVAVAAFAGPEDGPVSGGGGLAFTGADNMGLVFTAGGLLLAGAGAVTIAGRRRSPSRVS